MGEKRDIWVILTERYYSKLGVLNHLVWQKKQSEDVALGSGTL